MTGKSHARMPLHPAAQNGRKLLRYLEKKGKSISPLLIVTHDYPDPDAIIARNIATVRELGVEGWSKLLAE